MKRSHMIPSSQQYSHCLPHLTGPVPHGYKGLLVQYLPQFHFFSRGKMIFLTKVLAVAIALTVIGDIKGDTFPPYVPYKRAQRHTLPCITYLFCILNMLTCYFLNANISFKLLSLVLREFKKNGSKGGIPSWDQCVLRFHAKDINAMIYHEDNKLCTYGNVNEDQQEDPVFGREDGRESFFIRPVIST